MGLVTRDNLLVLLRKALVLDLSSDGDLLSRSELSYEDLNQLNVTAAARNLISQQQQAALQVVLDTLKGKKHWHTCKFHN